MSNQGSGSTRGAPPPISADPVVGAAGRLRPSGKTEVWIEAMHRERGAVRLTVLQSDGRLCDWVVRAELAEWLDLAPGQIVRLPLATA